MRYEIVLVNHPEEDDDMVHLLQIDTHVYPVDAEAPPYDYIQDEMVFSIEEFELLFRAGSENLQRMTWEEFEVHCDSLTEQ